MSLALIVPASLAAQAPEDPGPFAVGHREFTVAGGTGGNCSLLLRVHYPATQSGNAAPFATNAAPCPVLVFGHGFSLPATLYDTLYEHFASHGFVVAAPRTEEGLFSGNLPRFVVDQRAAVQGLRNEARDGLHGLKGAVTADVRAIAAGHSFGGAAAIVAASGHESLFAGVVTLAATSTSPQNVDILAAQRALAVPVLHLGASKDTIVPPAQNLDPLYGASRALRIFAELRGGTHSYFHEAWYADRLLEPAGDISVAEQQRLIRRAMLPFCELVAGRPPRFLDALLGPAAVQDKGLSRRGAELAQPLLFGSGQATLGGTFFFHPARQTGEIAITWLAGGAARLATPFGDLLLDPGSLILLGASSTGAEAFATQPLPIPNRPALRGLRLHAQALHLGSPETLGPALALRVE